MPSSYHPTSQQWRLWVAPSLSAQSKHLMQDYKQITVAAVRTTRLGSVTLTPTVHPCLSPPVSDFPLCWPAVPRAGLFPASHRCPFWKHARSLYVILWHWKAVIIIVTIVKSCINLKVEPCTEKELTALISIQSWSFKLCVQFSVWLLKTKIVSLIRSVDSKL